MHRLLTSLACGTLLILMGGCDLTTCSNVECAPLALDGKLAPATVLDSPPFVPPAVADGKTKTATVQEPDDVKYYRSDEPLRLAIEHFNRGNYGIAERYFRDATEKAPKDPTAWTGLAASYDRLARFDLADRAYAYAIRLAGETTEILNNQGYSYMLRGNLNAARRKFMQAYAREPNNPIIANNLQLLNGSSRFIKRDPNYFAAAAAPPVVPAINPDAAAAPSDQ
jgi:Flp pilus assembly protein TadD